jgi:hypothetical protein
MTPLQLSSRPLHCSAEPCTHCCWITVTPVGTDTLALRVRLAFTGGGCGVVDGD